MTRDEMVRVLRENHYTGSVPSGKSHYLFFGGAIIVFSIPANKNIAAFLRCKSVWELSRLWAPTGHEENLLTRAISWATREFKLIEPGVDALVSYADPNAGHLGGVYRAASWLYLGQCEEARAYRRRLDGAIAARRAFHSGKRGLKKAEIEALGYEQLMLPGKFRFARGLTKKTRKTIAHRQQELLTPKGQN